MAKNKRTKKSVIVALGLAASLAITGALAFFSDTDTDVNRFTFTDDNGEQTVDVEIVEPHWDAKAGENMLPGEIVAKDPEIQNKGENDVYGFVTVLIPTAKEINLNNADGTVATHKNVELFSYEAGDDWVEIEQTKAGIHTNIGNSKTYSDFTYNHLSKLGETDTMTNFSVTNKSDEDGSPNVYFTAHTYAYAKASTDKDRSGKYDMNTIASGETTSSLFKNIEKVGDYEGGQVKMINIADGEKTPKTLKEVYDSLVAADGTTLALDETKKVITATTGEGTSAVVKTLYSVSTSGDDEWVIDENGNKQYKVAAQLGKDDNVNIYVSTYAIQADFIPESDIDKVWNICSNSNFDVAEGSTFDTSKYFDVIDDDPGAKSAVAAKKETEEPTKNPS